MTRDEMLREMRALYRKSPKQFRETVEAFSEQGESIFPDRKPRRAARDTKAVLAIVWAQVQFIMWRDRLNIVDACRRLERHGGLQFSVFDAPDGTWKHGEPEPETFEYQPKPDGAIRKLYYMAEARIKTERNAEKLNLSKSGTELAGQLWLELMQCAHKGEPMLEGFDDKWLARFIPKPKKL
jgi:hypothetical protein